MKPSGIDLRRVDVKNIVAVGGVYYDEADECETENYRRNYGVSYGYSRSMGVATAVEVNLPITAMLVKTG